jgi:hypothetical protein
MLAAPIMGHDVIFKLFVVYCFDALFHSYKKLLGRWGREGFLLAKYYAELLLIGCMAWFDNKRRHLPMGCISAKIMVLQTHKNVKGEVLLTLPIQQAIAYSISCSKAEKEIDLLRD